jgi:hypothetical protein
VIQAKPLSTSGFDMAIRFFLKLLLLAAIMFLIDHALSGVLLNGLDRYDGLDKKPEILCIGHSHTICGIDDMQLAKGLGGISVSKYARHGADIFDRLIMLEDFFHRHPHTPQIVIYDVDPTIFNRQKISENSHTRFFPYIDTPEVADYLQAKCADRQEFITRKYLKLMRYNNSWLVRSSLKGYLGGTRDGYIFDKINYAKAEADQHNNVKNKEDVFDIRYFNAFQDTIRFLRSKDVRVVLLSIPTLDLYNNSYKAEEEYLEKTLSSLAAKDEGIFFLNYSKRYQADHEYFIDFEHVNRDGQLRVTEDLIKNIRPLLAEKMPIGSLYF